MYDQVEVPRTQQRLEKIDDQIQPNQKPSHSRSAISNLIVANRQHRESVNLVSVIENLRKPPEILKLPIYSFTKLPNPLMNGVIILDKPAGWTSHDVVNRMRRILQQRSVGHLGTLDPLATGVLPLVTGSLTRLAQFYISSEKTYEGVIRFGFATNTYDADGEPLEPLIGTAAPGSPGITPDLNLTALQDLAAEFRGRIQQVPPPFSAKKIHGIPAYKLARDQKEVVLQPVEVEIKEFIITAVDAGRAHFRARVASGTYMRSIAHAMGQRLGCGAHLESLRRTSVAEFDIAHAHTIEEIETCSGQLTTCHSARVRANASASRRIPTLVSTADVDLNPRDLSTHADSTETRTVDGLFIHPRQLLPQFPSVTADEATAARIRNGRPVNLPELSRARQVKVFASQTELLAIATRVAGTLFHPKIVFPSE
jgi:tRNA pseudouridine55 synthase